LENLIHAYFPDAKQGGQIGRIFAKWAIIYFEQLFM
jgi:hypothetical protein